MVEDAQPLFDEVVSLARAAATGTCPRSVQVSQQIQQLISNSWYSCRAGGTQSTCKSAHCPRNSVASRAAECRQPVCNPWASRPESGRRARYTCPPRGPLAQLGERRPCTAWLDRKPPLKTQETKRRRNRAVCYPQQPPRSRVGVSRFCRIGLPVLREPRPGRSMTCVRPLAHEEYDRIVRSREEAAHEGWRLYLRLIRISRGGIV